MKQFLSVSLLIVFAVAVQHPLVRAQGLPDSADIQTAQAVAFVKTDRSILYVKRPGVSVDTFDLAAIVNQIFGGTQPEIDSIRHLAVIGMTPDGSRLVLGASVTYIKLSDGQRTNFTGIMQIPWPLTQNNILADPLNTWFLLPARNGLGGFHPIGILSPDGSEWYAMNESSSLGTEPMVFYHGKTDGSGTVDSATVTAQVAGVNPPQGGWLTSNLGLDITNNTMVVASFDGLQDPLQSGRYLLIRWHPQGIIPVFSANNFTGGLKGRVPKMERIDSLFGLTVAPLQDGSQVEIGITNLNPNQGYNTIEFYYTRYDAGVDLQGPDRSIPRSVLPDSSNFFAGSNTAQYHDDISICYQHGLGGDMIFTRDGSKALFITHEYPENRNVNPGSPRNVKSGIFTYDFNGQAQLIYNDSNAQELQPIFVTAKDTIPHVPDIQANASSMDFGTVDTSKTKTQTVTITDNSIFVGTIIDSAKITGDAEFTIVSPTFPKTLSREGSVQVQVSFAPVGAAVQRVATLTIYSSMSTTKSIVITLKGTAHVQPTKGVREDPALAAKMEIEPNPFASSTSVRLVAPDAGALGIVVHDALGRTIYTSELSKVSAGASESFDFDAKSLGLPNGVYYVTALFGERQVSREVVFVR